MSFGDGIFRKLPIWQTPPGSSDARTQYRQMRLILTVQWVLGLVIAMFALVLSLLWIVLAIAAASVLSIPAQRRILRRLQKNAYPGVAASDSHR